MLTALLVIVAGWYMVGLIFTTYLNIDSNNKGERIAFVDWVLSYVIVAPMAPAILIFGAGCIMWQKVKRLKFV